ncbi:hypothetical protein B0J14DRAFT_675151 [Halenospora varia]|nr:hypothetical protein B0J14DRAFT_675151 [Halenospora varia]
MPMFFIWSLPRPVMERTLVSILMALGKIAAIAGVMKLHTLKVWNPREATLRDWVPLLWYRVEEIGLIAAACAPFLKQPTERALGRFGVTKFGFETITLPTIPSFQGSSAKDSSKKGSSIQRTSGRGKGGCA